MRSPIEPDFSLNRAARSCETARLDARSASRLILPARQRGLVMAAVRHLDRAQDQLFEAFHEPPAAPDRHRQLSLLGDSPSR